MIGESPVKRGWLDLPDGALAIAFLLLLSSVCGALIAIYWPFGPGARDAGVGDRLATLEARMDDIAAGHASKAAMQAFVDLRRDLVLLKAHLEADEARLAAIEKSDATQENTDLSELKAGADKSASDLRMLSGRIARFEQATSQSGPETLAQLRSALGDRSQALHDAISNLGERLTALEKSVPPGILAQKLDGFALRSEEAALETRIVKLENQDMTGIMRRAAAVMALADLVRASAGSDPFLDELSALRALAPPSPELDDLSRYAAKGVPTRTMLADSFSRQADFILASEHPGSTAKTLGDRIWSGVMLPVRRLGSIVSDDSEARVARAQVDLNLGELARAIHEVSALQGPPREVAGPWLKSANERLNVDRDARVLAQKLVANLPAVPPASQPGAAAGK